MSDKQVSELECSMCGLDGGSVPGCDLCRGTARNQPRSFTITEEARGLNPDKSKRYGTMGDTSPRIVEVPGGQHAPQRQ